MEEKCRRSVNSENWGVVSK